MISFQRLIGIKTHLSGLFFNRYECPRIIPAQCTYSYSLSEYDTASAFQKEIKSTRLFMQLLILLLNKYRENLTIIIK